MTDPVEVRGYSSTDISTMKPDKFLTGEGRGG